MVKSFLNDEAEGLGGRWIKNWPAASPDLNPLDYSVWHIMQKSVDSKKPTTRIELVTAVRKAASELTTDLAQKVVSDFANRLRACVDADGGHFEYKKSKKAAAGNDSPDCAAPSGPAEEAAGDSSGAMGSSDDPYFVGSECCEAGEESDIEMEFKEYY